MSLLKKIVLEYAILLEQDHILEQDPAQQAKDQGLQHIGAGYYSRTGQEPATHTTRGGSLRALTPDEMSDREANLKMKQQWGSPDAGQDVPDDPDFEKFKQQMAKGQTQFEPDTKPEPEVPKEKPQDTSLDGLEGTAKLLAIDAQQVNDIFRSTAESLKKMKKEREQYVNNGISQMKKRYGARWVSKARASGDQLEMLGPNGTIEKKSAGEWAETFIELKTNSNVGLGADESRAGEAAIVHGVNAVLDQYKKDPEGFKMSTVMGALREEFADVVSKPGAKLKEDWADVALNTVESLIEDYGPRNIQFAAWDTTEGNEAAQSWGHGTSADMFLRLNTEETVGVSLKKDYRVFFLNGGFGTVLDSLLNDISPEDAAEISDRVNMDSYFKRRTDSFIALAQVKGFKQEAERMSQSCIEGGECPLGSSTVNRLKKGVLTSAFDKLDSGEADNLTADEMKTLARIAAASNIPDAEKQVQRIREVANDTLEEVFNAAIDNEAFGNELKNKAVQGLHLTDTLGVALTNINEFVTYFGNERFDNKALLKYFLADDADVQELQASVRSDNKEMIDKFFRDRIALTYDKKSGKGQINFRRSNEEIDGQPRYMALAFCNLRERGIGTSPTFELGVSQELRYVLKYGPKFDEWPKRARTAWAQRQEKKGQIEDDVEAVREPKWNDPLVAQTKELVRSLAMRELERMK